MLNTAMSSHDIVLGMKASEDELDTTEKQAGTRNSNAEDPLEGPSGLTPEQEPHDIK